MKKILFITNIPSPYRVDFYNALGKYCDVTVVFEAKTAGTEGLRFNWNLDEIRNFHPVFLSEGDIQGRKLNWRIFRYLKPGQYDEIVTTNYSYLTEMAAFWYLKLFRIPYCLEIDGGKIRQERRLKKWYKTFLISGAKAYFSPSKVMDQYLIHYGADSRRLHRYPFTSIAEADVLPRVLTAQEKQAYRERIGCGAGRVALGVGQFIHRKGWDVLLEAAAQLPEVQFLIVGGTVTEEYTRLCEKWQLSNVRFEGFQGDRELQEYYRAADLFVFPTREDIWGLVINEAVAAGLPVVTTENCGAGLELVENGENGFLVPAEDAQALADKMKQILSQDDLREQMAAKSLEKSRSYTIERMAQAHARIFQELEDR